MKATKGLHAWEIICSVKESALQTLTETQPEDNGIIVQFTTKTVSMKQTVRNMRMSTFKKKLKKKTFFIRKATLLKCLLPLLSVTQNSKGAFSFKSFKTAQLSNPNFRIWFHIGSNQKRALSFHLMEQRGKRKLRFHTYPIFLKCHPQPWVDEIKN